jgi:hypothetical protein
MRDKTLACGEEHPTTAPSYEECVILESVETENPFGEF